jgi:hypothetical protein
VEGKKSEREGRRGGGRGEVNIYPFRKMEILQKCP